MDIDALATDCYYYGCLTNKCIPPLTTGMYGVGAGEVAEAALGYPRGGYETLYKFRSTSFLTCKISDHTSSAANVIIVPFKNEGLDADLAVDTTVEGTNLLSEWAVTMIDTNGGAYGPLLVFGTDMYMEVMTAYYTPADEDFSAANYYFNEAVLAFTTADTIIFEPESNVVILAADFDIDSTTSDMLIIGSTGISADLTFTSAGVSDWA